MIRVFLFFCLFFVFSCQSENDYVEAEIVYENNLTNGHIVHFFNETTFNNVGVVLTNVKSYKFNFESNDVIKIDTYIYSNQRETYFLYDRKYSDKSINIKLE